MRYTISELLTWGERKHYPQLVLSNEDILRHGELHWRRMAKDKERRQLAWQRIQAWNARTQEQIA
jgi:hypothetical protein